MNETTYKNISYNSSNMIRIQDLINEYNLEETAVEKYIETNGIDVDYDELLHFTRFNYEIEGEETKELPGYLSEYYWECILDEDHRLMGYVSYNTSSPHAMWLCNFDDDEDDEEYFSVWVDDGIRVGDIYKRFIERIIDFENGNYMSVDEFNEKYEVDEESDSEEEDSEDEYDAYVA